MSRKKYPPLTGETMAWLDLARVTAFCSVRGLHVSTIIDTLAFFEGLHRTNPARVSRVT